MKSDYTTIESLVKGGLIGATLGSFLSEDKEEGAIIGALLGAAFLATMEASEQATKTKVPLYVEEDGKLYTISKTGQKTFVRNTRRSAQKFPEKFKLK